MMESMGVRCRPEVSLGAVVRDTAADLTGIGSYWRAIFANSSGAASAATGGDGDGNISARRRPQKLDPHDVASRTPILSVLGNSTRSYPRLRSVSDGFVDALRSRRNAGYMSRDIAVGMMPEKDDCEEALEYCREVADVYEPPMGSGLLMGENENDDLDAYFDEIRE